MKPYAMCLVVLMACPPQKGLFEDLKHKKKVVIVLSNYNLTSLPQEIGALTKATSLTVSIDSIKNGWSIYPPRSAYDYLVAEPPFNKLPEAICRLQNLDSLTLMDLKLKELPENFHQLENLQYLNLANNKLTISKEISKLKKLKKLKFLEVFANKVDTLAMQEWMNENPNLQILY